MVNILILRIFFFKENNKLLSEYFYFYFFLIDFQRKNNNLKMAIVIVRVFVKCKINTISLSLSLSSLCFFLSNYVRDYKCSFFINLLFHQI